MVIIHIPCHLSVRKLPYTQICYKICTLLYFMKKIPGVRAEQSELVKNLSEYANFQTFNPSSKACFCELLSITVQLIFFPPISVSVQLRCKGFLFLAGARKRQTKKLMAFIFALFEKQLLETCKLPVLGNSSH